MSQAHKAHEARKIQIHEKIIPAKEVMVQNSLAIQKSTEEQTEGEGEEGKNFLIFRCRKQGGFLARFHVFKIHIIMSRMAGTTPHWQQEKCNIDQSH